MSDALTGYYKRIIRREIKTGRFTNEGEVVRHSLRLLDAMEHAAGPPETSFANGRQLETLLLDGLESGAATPMTARRRQKIYASLENT